MRTELNFDDGQEGNQFPELDGQLSILGLWHWRCVADRSVGTLCLESVLQSPELPVFGQS